MKNEQARAVTHKMAAECDVIVEAFRPGVMAKFGLDYESVKKVNPNVIYLSVTGFGQTGPNKDLPVTDAVIQAFSGLMTVNKDSQGLPNRLNMIPIDVTTGLYAFQALSTALMRKFRYGTGCYIDNNLACRSGLPSCQDHGIPPRGRRSTNAVRARRNNAHRRRLHQHHSDARASLQSLM